MPELKVIVMPPDRRWARPKRSWRNPGRDTVAERIARDQKYITACRFIGGGAASVAFAASFMAAFAATCLAVDTVMKVVG